MYERMLNKQVMPAIEEMTSYCGECGEYFILLNEWMTDVFGTEQQVFFLRESMWAGNFTQAKEKAHM